MLLRPTRYQRTKLFNRSSPTSTLMSKVRVAFKKRSGFSFLKSATSICVASFLTLTLYFLATINRDRIVSSLPSSPFNAKSPTSDADYLPRIDPTACLNLTPAEREKRFTKFGEVYERVEIITRHAGQYIFLREPKVLLYFLLKGGSRALLGWLYQGVVGEGTWADASCKTYIQDINSTCWAGHAFFMSDLDLHTQLRLFTSDDVLRVAIQRDPYERLVSAFKGKFACGREVYNGDPLNSSVLQLSQQTNLRTAQPNCMNISEFAQALHTLRTLGHTEGIAQPKFAEAHVRIQNLHDQEIDYDLVLDPRYFKYPKHLKLLYDRLPFKNLVEPYIPVRHASSGAEVHIPEQAEAELRAYAELSKPIPLRSCDRF